MEGVTFAVFGFSLGYFHGQCGFVYVEGWGRDGVSKKRVGCRIFCEERDGTSYQDFSPVDHRDF